MVPAVTCSKLAAAERRDERPECVRDERRPTVTGSDSLGDPPDRKAPTMSASPLASTRTAHRRKPSYGQWYGLGSRTASAAGSSSTDIPGALSE